MNNENHFNKTSFARLLDQAKGKRSINQYARDCGVSTAHISRFLRELVDSPPAPETILKLVSSAHGGVTYEELMDAAGHFIHKEETGYEIYHNEEKNDDSQSNSDDFYKIRRKNHLERRERRNRIFKLNILTYLYDESLEFREINEIDNIWRRRNSLFLEIKNQRNIFLFEGPLRDEISEDKRMIHHFIRVLDMYGEIALNESLDPSDRCVIVVDHPDIFERILRRKPKLLNINIDLMLINSREGIVERSEPLCTNFTD
ncbi:hypothetical protein [Salisediminibacterium selenitireducens]|uniref:Uncharacterized protein n=1 Tax=Bacillus selenitireducens (strain ATCC 700615 / DSM 15326 / MLS10) TaxID=439292 RepID=D6Y010_BACIE|nr:hypothetical protein [Salisediminibacterium selenitireducens]ADI00512.1 hypothetical protein Bsel_3030 [[Bacillus] selenitireducens MLS10]